MGLPGRQTHTFRARGEACVRNRTCMIQLTFVAPSSEHLEWAISSICPISTWNLEPGALLAWNSNRKTFRSTTERNTGSQACRTPINQAETPKLTILQAHLFKSSHLTQSCRLRSTHTLSLPIILRSCLLTLHLKQPFLPFFPSSPSTAPSCPPSPTLFLPSFTVR